MVGKSFLKIGTTYFDIGPLCSFNFYPDKHGYVIMFLHFLSKDQPIKVKIKNKNELSEFFYGLDKYIDQDFRESLMALIEEIDKLKQNQRKENGKHK